MRSIEESAIAHGGQHQSELVLQALGVVLSPRRTARKPLAAVEHLAASRRASPSSRLTSLTRFPRVIESARLDRPPRPGHLGAIVVRATHRHQRRANRKNNGIYEFKLTCLPALLYASLMLSQCNECSNQVSTRAAACPLCGARRPTTPPVRARCRRGRQGVHVVGASRSLPALGRLVAGHILKMGRDLVEWVSVRGAVAERRCPMKTGLVAGFGRPLAGFT